MKSNTLTIIKKEFARFFGDRQLLFTTVILPGLLIYTIYSFMGDGINKMITEGMDEKVELRVENMPKILEPVFDSLEKSNILVSPVPFTDKDIQALEDNEQNRVLLRFPAGFENKIASFDPRSGELPPNVEIYYNSTNNAANKVYTTVSTMLNNFGRTFTVNVPQSKDQHFDQATEDSIGAKIWSKILPMLIMMLLFSGVMAIAPSAIAGEKERGTIATLLVTPMRRNELALGKIISLSGIALLSGISSFIGIAFSLPNMVQSTDGSIPFHYGFNDYLVLLIIIFASVLIMASAVSLLSALAKDVKNAGTMVTPFMLVVMLCGLLPMFQSSTTENLAVYFIPFYNSIEVMTATFAHEMKWMPVIVTVASNLVYTGVAVWGLTKMFNSEKVMFSK